METLQEHDTGDWLPLDSQEAANTLLAQFNGFHDACLREVSLATETYVVDERRAMSCPGRLDTSALLYFQGQGRNLSAIEVRCIGLSRFGLRPTADNHDSIISYRTVQLDGERCRIAVYFLGRPLIGSPNSWLEVVPSPPEDPDLEVLAQRIERRGLPNTFGNRLRYRDETA